MGAWYGVSEKARGMIGEGSCVKTPAGSNGLSGEAQVPAEKVLERVK